MKYAIPLGLAAALSLPLTAAAQTLPPTPQQLQEQTNQSIQNQNTLTQQNMNQVQTGQIQDQQRRDQLFSSAPNPLVTSNPYGPPPGAPLPPPKK